MKNKIFVLIAILTITASFAVGQGTPQFDINKIRISDLQTILAQNLATSNAWVPVSQSGITYKYDLGAKLAAIQASLGSLASQGQFVPYLFDQNEPIYLDNNTLRFRSGTFIQNQYGGEQSSSSAWINKFRSASIGIGKDAQVPLDVVGDASITGTTTLGTTVIPYSDLLLGTQNQTLHFQSGFGVINGTWGLYNGSNINGGTIYGGIRFAGGSTGYVSLDKGGDGTLPGLRVFAGSGHVAVNSANDPSENFRVEGSTALNGDVAIAPQIFSGGAGYDIAVIDKSNNRVRTIPSSSIATGNLNQTVSYTFDGVTTRVAINPPGGLNFVPSGYTVYSDNGDTQDFKVNYNSSNNVMTLIFPVAPGASNITNFKIVYLK